MAWCSAIGLPKVRMHQPDLRLAVLVLAERDGHLELPPVSVERLENNRDDLSRTIEPYLGEPTFLQLQYSQTAILIFNGVLWPHVTVATLTLSNG